MPTNTKTSPVIPSAPDSYLEWAPVFGGAAIAGAITLVLVQFASGVGLAAAEPLLEDGSASWSVLVAGLWVVLVSLASSTAGGYVAGRLRARAGDAVEAEAEFRDGAHGLVVWAVATVTVGAVMALGAAFAGIAGALASEAATAAAPSPTEAQLAITANVSTIFGFATSAGAALGAAAAWFAAVTGGQHRDEGTSVHVMVPKMFRRSTAG